MKLGRSTADDHVLNGVPVEAVGQRRDLLVAHRDLDPSIGLRGPRVARPTLHRRMPATQELGDVRRRGPGGGQALDFIGMRIISPELVDPSAGTADTQFCKVDSPIPKSRAA